MSLASCQDIIEIDLNSTDPTFVIQGSITDQLEPHVITIQKTVNFDQPNEYPNVSGALVTMSDGTLVDTLAEVNPGVYQTQKLNQGVSGKTYLLNVEAEGQSFEAASTMPPVVPFDTVVQGSFVGPGTGNLVTVVPIYRDPIGIGNYYRFKLKRNANELSDINVRDDKNNDGIRLSQPIISFVEDFVAGDIVELEMQTIDKQTYKYFISLGGSGGPNNTATPANPVTNLTNNALGYFSAHTVQKKSIVIK